MRQIFVEVPRGRGQEAFAMAEAHQATNLVRVEAEGRDAPVDLVIAHVGNATLGDLLEDLHALPDLRVTFAPQGVLALRPPHETSHQQVTEVAPRSPVEIFLSGLQSVGSWRAFLGYAAAAGAVVWIGLFTNTTYLLTAAMLIAPFAGPAMNSALATARGDLKLLGRSLLRYFASLLVAVAVAAAFSALWRQDVATTQMVDQSQVSSAAVLLPLVAGAAGALNLCQSARSSLVTGAATGMLVAVSLAPPAGLVGIAAVLGRWDMVKNGVFVILLQVAGINLAGAVVFRLYGVSPRGSRYERGRRGVWLAALAGSVVLLAALLGWQLATRPELQRSTRAERAAAEIHDVLSRSELVELIEADARFTRASIPGQNTLLAVVYVQRRAGVELPAEGIRERITRAIQDRLRHRGFHVTPLVDVTVLDAPARGGT